MNREAAAMQRLIDQAQEEESYQRVLEEIAWFRQLADQIDLINSQRKARRKKK